MRASAPIFELSKVRLIGRDITAVLKSWIVQATPKAHGLVGAIVTRPIQCHHGHDTLQTAQHQSVPGL